MLNRNSVAKRTCALFCSVAWMDGRSDDVRKPAYEARGYKQAGQTDRRADMQADGPNRQRFWLVLIKVVPGMLASVIRI